MSTRRDSLSDAKRALLEQRMRGRPSVDNAAEIPRRPASAAPILSPGQQRLWFLHQLAPESAAYTMFDARRFSGPMDVAALRTSIAGVAQRHEILRTCYEARDGRPCAFVQRDAAVDLEMIALDSAPAADRERLARENGAAFIRRPFDLRVGPVLRAALIRVGVRDHVLVLAVHHIACDEWSLDIIWRELAMRYASERAGRPVALGAPGLQYADFAHWQAQRLGGGEARRHLEHWRKTLGGCAPPLELPPDRVPPARRSLRGGLVLARLDAAVAQDLAALARRAGTTSFVLHLSALNVLLHRYTGETDVVIGIPATGRNRQALESVVGFFLNTLPLRTDISGDPPFREVLRRVHAAFLDGITHQVTPFEAIVHTIAPERQLRRNPLFSVMFVEKGGTASVAFGNDVTVSRYRLDGGASKFDLTLFAGDDGAGFETMIEYDADRFEHATATRMLEQFGTLLGAIAEDPDRPISMLPLASPVEARLIAAWSRGPTPVDSADAVHRQFWKHARATPGRTAIVSDGESLSYERLGERASAVARRLSASGIGPNERVALCADRSPDMIVGIVGILEAGAAYVPLDPAYPPFRHAFAIRDSGARIVLATRARAGQVPATDAAVLLLDGDEAATDGIPPATDVALADAAYVLHTSGSTGAPKGVVITHGNLAYSTAARAVAYPEPPDVFMLLPSFAFDSSVAGIFWTLTTGGTLALPPQRIEQDVQALAAFSARHAVTHTLCLPSLWETILEHAPAGQLHTLRTVIVAGEACSTGLVRRHHDVLPDVSLWNEYGPTEATVWSTVWAIPRAFDGARVPIGSPIAGTRVHVLDAGGAPAAIGVPGELCIGGAGVARGYLNRPEESALRFVPDPFSADPAARLYRTGDRARWREDGALEFLGRVDQQVKVRGHRIEPGEIESVLRQHDGIRDAVVAARAVAPQFSTPAMAVDRLVDAVSVMDAREAERILEFVEQLARPEAS